MKKKSSCRQSHTKLRLHASVTGLVEWKGEGRTPRYFHIASGGPALLCIILDSWQREKKESQSHNVFKNQRKS